MNDSSASLYIIGENGTYLKSMPHADVRCLDVMVGRVINVRRPLGDGIPKNKLKLMAVGNELSVLICKGKKYIVRTSLLLSCQPTLSETARLWRKSSRRSRSKRPRWSFRC